jgi:membrane glycosyltransferase
MHGRTAWVMTLLFYLFKPGLSLWDGSIYFSVPSSIPFQTLSSNAEIGNETHRNKLHWKTTCGDWHGYVIWILLKLGYFYVSD